MKSYFQELLEEAAAFHGHLCPGQVLGVRMALLGCGLLGIHKPREARELIVYVETDRCASDAVQIVTGCRLGKGALKYVDYGKMAVTFVNLNTGNAVRVAAREDVRETAAGCDGGLPIEDAQDDAYAALTDEELFSVQKVTVDIPREDRPGHLTTRMTCADCGEGVSDGREVVVKDRVLCRACAQGSYYQIVESASTPEEIPEVVILRLPLYVRVLSQLESRGNEIVSSQALGALLQINPGLVRKDLHYCGRFGTQGQGYPVRQLKNELRQILGLDRKWTMALVGVGQLGTAIVSYGGFQQQGFRIVAAFDTDPARVGSLVGDLIIQDTQELHETVCRKQIEIGIVAVPAAQGQGVVDALVASGIKGIVNYAPFRVHVPPNVWVREIDPVVLLQSLTFHLKSVGPKSARLKSAGGQRQATSMAFA